MITTHDLIESLVAKAAPVKRLRSPVANAAQWLLFAAFMIALLGVAQDVRPDLDLRLQEPLFVIAFAAALTTGVLAAIASFMVSVPDRSRGWLFLPVPSLAVWFSVVGYGCLTNWVSIQPGAITLGETARCFATLVLVGAPLSLAALVMLRHAAPLAPTPVAITASLAVAAMTATALSLFHELDATAMILLWNLGTVAVLVALGGTFARRMSWRAALH